MIIQYHRCRNQIHPSLFAGCGGPGWTLAGGRGELGRGPRLGDVAGGGAAALDRGEGALPGLDAAGVGACFCGEYVTGLSCVVEGMRIFGEEKLKLGCFGVGGRVLFGSAGPGDDCAVMAFIRRGLGPFAGLEEAGGGDPGRKVNDIGIIFGDSGEVGDSVFGS